MGLKLNKIDTDYTDNLDDLGDKSDDQKALQDDTTMLLYSIIQELKIMNLHLAILTDTMIEKTEVE